MDGQSEFRTSSVLLTAAMMVCGVMGLFMFLPALRNRSEPPATGTPQTSHLPATKHRDDSFSELVGRQQDASVQKSSDLRETVVNVGSRGTHSVSPVVVTRQVNNGNSGDQSGRSTDQPPISNRRETSFLQNPVATAAPDDGVAKERAEPPEKAKKILRAGQKD